MSSRCIGIRVEVTGFVSTEPQPGLVRCEFRDAAGRLWTFVEKPPDVCVEPLDEASHDPRPGVVECRVVGRRCDESGGEVIAVETELFPEGVASISRSRARRGGPGRGVETFGLARPNIGEWPANSPDESSVPRRRRIAAGGCPISWRNPVMMALSPLECFVIGVAASVVAMGVLGLALWRGVVRHRRLDPDGSPGPFVAPRPSHEVQALQRRLQAVEERLADVEERLSREVTA